MEVTTKKQNRRKIVIGVLIAVVVLVAAVIAFASSYLVNYAIGRSGDGGDREVALDVEAPTVGVEQLIAENRAVQKQANEEFLQQNPGQTVQITAADGLRLNGVYYPNAGSHLWVIALHGYRGSHTGATNLAQHYYDAGYQVLAPDLAPAATVRAIMSAWVGWTARMCCNGSTGCWRRTAKLKLCCTAFPWVPPPP